MNLGLIYTQTITAGWLTQHNVALDVLRLDEMHPVVSGNKWFKLQYYLQHALQHGHHTIATFGGAWSNHIVATAFTCRQAGLNSVGFIRGEEPAVLSSTLLQAQRLHMQLVFVSREQYRNKEEIKSNYEQPGWYVVNEGGYGLPGAAGAAEILDHVSSNDYTHIVCACGTGTMLAGLVRGAQLHQQIIGISSMKGNNMLEKAVKDLLPEGTLHAPFQILHDYHFGGYGKHPAALLAFINQAWSQFQLPLDIVYTSKVFFAIMDMVTKRYFPVNSKVLMIHSGGLQGNNSVANNQLSFS